MQNQATDLIAKLLATEDLSVVHAAVSTASFNIKSRVLTLPIWKDASDDLMGMLVGHEVGHALYTTDAYGNHEYKDSCAFQTYMNVLEDVRIEKLMKRKYPGIRKTFMAGYKELNDNDFFEVKTRDLTDALLIDKINLYFKVGCNCGVTFNKTEKDFVDRAERTETIEDVFNLAKEIFEYTKEELKKAEEEAQMLQESEDGEFGEADEGQQGQAMDDFGTDSDEEDIHGTTSSQNSQEDEDDKLASKTETSYQKRMEDMADTSTIYKYWNLGKFCYDPIVPYNRIFKMMEEGMQRHIRYGYINDEKMAVRKAKAEEFKSSSTPVVSYLIKEFEMKKAATAYKRTTIAKTGQLDTRKLASYKLKDDIFKRMSIVNEGKNHGMLFLLDWSGSMSSNIEQTLEQVINLAMFCRRAQIPFQVFAFADSVKIADFEYKPFPGCLEVNESKMTLLEFFSHKMSNSEFNKMIDWLKCWKDEFIRLHSTPLNEALTYMVDYIGEFQRKNNIEKMTFITLTDGEGGALQPVNGTLMDREYKGGIDSVSIKHFLRDNNSKKSYQLHRYEPSMTTNALLNIIKDRYDVTILGFYLTHTGWNQLARAVKGHYAEVTGIASMVERMKKEIKEKGYASLKGTGRDDLFIVPAQSRIENASVDSIKEGSAAAMARQFGKALNKRKTSRVLLNNFIEYIA